jgi:hypothetical protein
LGWASSAIDAGHTEAGGSEQDRVQTPGEPVVDVVDQPGLAGRGQGLLPEAGEGEDLPAGQAVVVVAVQWRVGSGFVPGMMMRFVDEHSGQPEAEGGERDPDQERRGP